MNEPNDQIQRLGFEAWADNLIINAVENLEALEASELSCDGCTTEGNDVTVSVRLRDGEINATVRAWIKGKGWHYHDRVIKVGGQK